MGDMDHLITVFVAFWLPVWKTLTFPSDPLYWLNILSAYLLAFFVITRGWTLQAAKDCLAELFAKRIWLHRSSIADFKLLFANNMLYFFLLPVVTLTSTGVAALVLQGLQQTTGSDGLQLAPTWASRLALTFCWLIAWDFGVFFTHYLQHKIPYLWEFHKIHHSAEVLTPVTVYRMHPVDQILKLSIVASLIGLVEGSFLYLYADPVTFYLVNGLNALWFLYLFGGYNLRHCHVWIMFPKPIRGTISSPALHLIHHSTNPKHWDKNFAPIFIIWDRLFGTLYMPTSREEIEFGLGDEEGKHYTSLWNIYVTPFKALAGRSLGHRRAEGSEPSSEA